MTKKIEDLENIKVSYSIIQDKLYKDDRFTSGRIRVMHAGLNRNKTYFSRETAEKLVRSMRGMPVTGKYNYLKGDFESHGKLFGAKDGPTPYGFVPFDAEYRWEAVQEEGETIDYLSIEVAMWTKKYPEIGQFISQSKNQSMELVPDDVYGYAGVKEGQECLVIEEAKGLALTILGDDVPPAFKSSRLEMYEKNETFENKFSQMVEVYNKCKGGLEDTIGGKTVFKFNEDIENLLKKESFSTIKDETHYVNVMPLQTSDKGTYGYSYEDGVLIFNDDSEEVKTLDLPSAYSNQIEIDAVNVELEESNTKYEEIVTEKDAVLEEKSGLEVELKQAKKDNSELEEKYQESLTANEELELKINSLSEYKLDKEKSEKELVLEKYSKILTEEEKASYTKSLGDKTIEELKYELGVKAFEALDDESINTFNLTKKKNTKVGPSWAQAINKRKGK